MSDYQDLYNIEHTGDPFSARFIKKTHSELPPDCILPDELNFIPELPTIEVTLPDLECKFDINEPIVPPPYFCTPAVGGEITMSVCDDSPGVTITGGATIARKDNTECDFELTGNFEFCMPCIPTFGGGISFGTCQVEGKNSARVNVVEPIGISYDPIGCSYSLEGAVEVCVPCIPTFSGSVGFSACTVDGRGNATRINVVEPVELKYIEQSCEYQLAGKVEVCSPCIPTFSPNIDVQMPSGGKPAVSITPLTMSFNEGSCVWDMHAAYKVECIPEFDSKVKLNITDVNGILSGNAALTFTEGGGGCQKSLEGDINLNLGCVMQRLDVGNISVKNMIQGQTTPVLDVTVGCAGGSCCSQASLDMDLQVAACSDVKINVGDDAEFDFPIKWGDHDVGSITLTVRYFIETENECTKTLRLEATGYSATLNLPTTDLTLCSGDGSSESITVLIPPGSQSGGGQS